MTTTWILVAGEPRISNLVAIAREFGGDVTAAVVGPLQVAEQVAHSGVDKVIWFGAPAPAEAMAQAVAAAVKEARPRLILGASRDGERVLLERFGRPVWVSHWDHLAVPFYQAFDRPGTARNADLLLGLGEVVGLGERHPDGDGVRRALALHQVDPGPYRWYVDLHDQRPLATSGFGMGVERFLAWVLGHDDIRDLQVLPRVHGKELIP